MGDRTSVTLTIPAVYKEAALVIFGDETPADSFINGVAKDNPHNLHCFAWYEVNYGTLPFLDALMAAGIPFDSNWDHGGEYGPGCETCRFTEEGEAIRQTVSDDGKNPDLGCLLELINQPDALRNFILRHHAEVTPMTWNDQIDYAKRYRLKQLIQSQQE